MYVEICSDAEPHDCCQTGVLESLLSDDWSAGDTEQWPANFLGPCQNKVFNIHQGFQLKLSKEGDDNLAVTDITIVAGKETCDSFWFWTVNCEIVERESFSCGSYDLGDMVNGGVRRSRSRHTSNCRIKVIQMDLKC